MIVKTLICDDNEKSRYILKEYLKMIPVMGVEVVGEAQNGYELIDLCKRDCPDLILLDIDMPFMNGIETAKQIIEFLPDVSFIFITAYPSFSIEAFEVHPVDFILKPVSTERLEKSLNYIIEKASSKSTLNSKQYLTVSIGHEFYPIKQSEILFVERIQRKTVIHTLKKAYEIYETLDSLQSKLDSEIFCRVHNSYIVNINTVVKLIRHSSGANEINFGSYKGIAYASRRNVAKLDSLLKYVTK